MRRSNPLPFRSNPESILKTTGRARRSRSVSRVPMQPIVREQPRVSFTDFDESNKVMRSIADQSLNANLCRASPSSQVHRAPPVSAQCRRSSRERSPSRKLPPFVAPSPTSSTASSRERCHQARASWKGKSTGLWRRSISPLFRTSPAIGGFGSSWTRGRVIEECAHNFATIRALLTTCGVCQKTISSWKSQKCIGEFSGSTSSSPNPQPPLQTASSTSTRAASSTLRCHASLTCRSC